jgi:hypothetical protein
MAKRRGKQKKTKKEKKQHDKQCMCIRCRQQRTEMLLMRDHNALVNVIDILVEKKILIIPAHARLKNMKTLDQFDVSPETENTNKEVVDNDESREQETKEEK